MYRFALPFAFFVSLLAGPSAAGQTTWEGATVLPKKIGVPIALDGQAGKSIAADEPSYRVLKEEKDRVLVETMRSVKGWLAKADAVPLEEAAAYFSGIVAKEPGNVDALQARAWAEQLQNELDDALKDYDACIRLKPSAVLYNNRALAWSAKGDSDKALADFDEALRLDKGNALAYFNRGNLHYERKETDKALADYDTAIRIDDKVPAYYDYRGYVFRMRHQPDQAIANFDTALRLDPTYSYSYYNRAACEMEKSDFDKAFADLKECLKYDPDYIYAYSRIGQVFYVRKDYDAALANWHKAMSMDANYSWPYMRIANFMATCPVEKYRDGPKAVELASKALELNMAPDPIFYEALAAAHAEVGNFPEALRWQEKAMEDPFLKSNATSKKRLESYQNEKAFRME